MDTKNYMPTISQLVLSSTNIPINEEIRPYTIKDEIYYRFRCWCDETTSHGIAFIIKRKRIYAKFIWLMFTLTAIGLCIYMIRRMVTEYLDFDVTTKIRKESQTKVPFPVVSICNANPMVTREASDYIRDHFNHKLNLSVSTFEQLLDELKYIDDISYHAEIDWLNYQTYDPNFNDTLRKSFGYPVDVTILSATLYGVYLDTNENFEWYYNFDFGNCYRFNYKPREDGSYHTQDFTNDGLKLDMFVGLPDDSMDYFYQPSTNGLFVLIEDQDSFPIQKQGILIHPGTYTKISYSRVQTETQSDPYSDCVDADMVDTLMSREMKKIGMKYTRRNCLDLLMAKIALDKIGCYDQRYPRILNATACSNYTEYRKLFSFVYLFQNYFQYCPFECNSVEFDLTISTQEYPSYNLYRQLMANYEDSLEQSIYRTDNLTFEMYKKSSAYVYVEIDDLRVTHISESPSVTLPDLLANLGGTLGLFIGVSILSFVEVIELGIEMCAILFKRVRCHSSFC